jgi:DNA-binding NarL/FixJ family response regulator
MPEILIVEDHPIVANGLQKLILEKGIASKCSIAYCIKDCMNFLKIFTPDLILLDFQLPDGNGNAVCKTIKQSNDHIKVLAISSYREQSIVKLMIDSGASGYVIKNASEEEITDAINTVLAGNQYLCNDLQEISPESNSFSIISNREIEVLQLVADGLTTAEIAAKLYISTSTVDSHRNNIMLKLNANNTASLIRIAIQKGYVSYIA